MLRPVNIEGTQQLQHLNPMFNLQDNPSHKKFEDFVTMAEGEEHQNTEKPMNTQELLTTMAASQIQLKEDLFYSSFRT